MNFLKRNNRPLRLKALTVLMVTLAFSSILITSCKKDLFELDRLRDPVWEPSLALPLVNSTLTVPDILDRFDDDEIIVVDSDGLLALLYRSRLFSVDAAQLLQLQDQTTNVTFSLDATQIAAIELGGGSATANQSFNYTFTTNNGEQLTEITFRSGDLTFDYSNNIPHDATVTISIPGLTLGGASFTTTQSIPANSTRNFNVPLAGRILDLTSGTGGASSNAFAVNFSITFTQTGAGATPINTFSADFGLKSFAFSLVRGDIGQPNISTSLDSVRVRLFENSIDGNVYWEDPRIRAIFTNSYGVGVQVDVNTLQSRSNLSPALTIMGSPFGEGSTILINQAAAIGLPTVSNYVMDRNSPGSNLVTVTNSSPTKIIYDINIMANPGTGPFNNFLADTSKVTLDMELELPFWGRADNFTKQDTTRFDTVQFDDVTQIEAITFRLAVDNGFPIDCYGQVYFMDSAGTVLDSLIKDPAKAIIASGVVDPNTLRVTARTKAITDIVLTRDQLDYLVSKKMFENGMIVSKGVAFTTNLGTTSVKVFNTYDMNLRLGVKVDLKQSVPLDSIR